MKNCELVGIFEVFIDLEFPSIDIFTSLQSLHPLGAVGTNFDLGSLSVLLDAPIVINVHMQSKA